MSDTIFAPITTRGRSAVCVIRISGDKVKEILNKLSINGELVHRMSYLKKIRDLEGNILDEVLLIYFKAPNSFTGEDVCEISFHSSNYIINKFFDILSSFDNVRIAEPGEFSRRAFLNGKLDLMQAEAIIDLIESETEIQHRQAMKQLSGNLSNFYKNLRLSIVEVLAIIEAFIDFPEDNIPQDLLNEINTKIQKIISEIEKELKNAKVGEKIRDGLIISIIGKPNVGKSSLMNYLAKRDVSIVSECAGTTRDVLELSMNINGIPAILCDTAGIRKTNDIVEKEGVKRALKSAKESDLKILLLSPENVKIESEIKDFIDNNTIIVLNKSDLIKDKNNIIEEIKKQNDFENDIVLISVKEKTGLENLISSLDVMAHKIISPNNQTYITRERHREQMEIALKFLKMFSVDEPIEICAENIRLAANSIGNIVGNISNDEILDNIFSKFCIGK